MEYASYRQYTFATTDQSHPKPKQQCVVYTRLVRSFSPQEWRFPPFPSSNFNTNPTLGGSISFQFGWNWNSNTSHGQQNVGLAFFGSSSHQLGNNPSLSTVGGTPRLGQQSTGSQPIPTPQQNVGFNPYSTEELGGSMASSQPLSGPVQSSSNFQQMGGSNAPLNPSAQPGQVLQQHQQPLNMGPFIVSVPYKQPNVGTSNVLPITTPQGGSNYQPGWVQPRGTYAVRGPQSFGNVPFARGFNLSQQGGYTMPYANQPQMGGYTQFSN